MMSNNYQAMIRLPSVGLQTITIQAKNLINARQLLEMQYGTGNVINLHQH